MRVRSLCIVLCLLLLPPLEARPQTRGEPTVTDFKAQPLYRAASLTWKMRRGREGGLTVRILRSDTFSEGPYLEIGTVQSAPSKTAYEFVDKGMGTEARYYYKLIVTETEETFGPVPTRPYFSPPATQALPQVKFG